MLFENVTKHDVELNLKSSQLLKWLLENRSSMSIRLVGPSTAKLHVT